LQVIPLPSRLITSGSDLLTELELSRKKARKTFSEGDLVVIASKAVAYCQRRIEQAESESTEKQVIGGEADHFLAEHPYPLTIKDSLLIPRAGVDNSNVPAGQIILWPKKSWQVATKIRREICEKYGLKNFGVVISDSTCRPLRWGVSGIALAWAGFAGVEDCRRKKDLFGNKLKVTQKAQADNLAATAGIVSGEGDESIPFVLFKNAPIKFTARTRKPKTFQPADCLFAPIYDRKFRNLKI